MNATTWPNFLSWSLKALSSAVWPTQSWRRSSIHSALSAAAGTGAGAAVPGVNETRPLLLTRIRAAPEEVDGTLGTGGWVVLDDADSPSPAPANKDASPLASDDVVLCVSAMDSSCILLSPSDALVASVSLASAAAALVLWATLVSGSCSSAVSSQSA